MKIIKLTLCALCVMASLLLVACGKEHEHHWVNGKITKPSTVSEYGEMTFECQFCDATSKRAMDKLPHDHIYGQQWEKNEIKHWHTCTVEGCSSVSDSSEHTWDEGVVLVQSTATTPGRRLYTCTACGSTRELAYVASFKVTEEQLLKAISREALAECTVKYKSGDTVLDITISGGLVVYTDASGARVETEDTLGCPYGSYGISAMLSVASGIYSGFTYNETMRSYEYIGDNIKISFQFADGLLTFASIITDEKTVTYNFSY